jgi:predicted nucleotidyltransferase
MNALPEGVERALNDFLTAAKAALGERLTSVVLFGSAAEGRMRTTSDVNLILVLSQFRREDVEALAPALRLARAAIRLEPMFLLGSEVQAAAEAFAQKFSDIGRRRRVLYGPDVFAELRIPRPAEIFRLRQVLLNLAMRLRESFAQQAGREDQVALLIADAAGPLRTSAAALAALEGGGNVGPKEALAAFVESNREWTAAARLISEIREQRSDSGARPAEALFSILEMTEALRRRVEALP